LASSPGRISRTDVWISREEMVDFLEYCASSGEKDEKRRMVAQESRRTGCLGRDTLEDVVDEAVENSHCLVRDTRIGVDLLKDWRSGW
jgi:hypothetical protein